MKFSVSIYSFFSSIRKGEITPVECVAKAKELEFDAVEAVDFVNFSGDKENMLRQAAELKNEAEKQGLPISSLAIGADFLNGSDGDRAAEIRRVKDFVDVAAALGAPKMRHDITQGYPRNSGKYKSYEKIGRAHV